MAYRATCIDVPDLEKRNISVSVFTRLGEAKRKVMILTGLYVCIFICSLLIIRQMWYRERIGVGTHEFSLVASHTLLTWDSHNTYSYFSHLVLFLTTGLSFGCFLRTYSIYPAPALIAR